MKTNFFKTGGARLCRALIFSAAGLAGAQVTVPDDNTAKLPGVIHPVHRGEITLIVPAGPFYTNRAPHKIPAELSWTIVTNWTTVYKQVTTNMLAIAWSNGSSEPGIENGVVSSNLVASIVWKGKTNTLTLESIPFTNLTRSYTYVYQRVYRD